MLWVLPSRVGKDQHKSRSPEETLPIAAETIWALAAQENKTPHIHWDETLLAKTSRIRQLQRILLT